jgi:hypothetical protein
MRISKKRLRKIIREQIIMYQKTGVINEGFLDILKGVFGGFKDVLSSAFSTGSSDASDEEPPADKEPDDEGPPTVRNQIFTAYYNFYDFTVLVGNLMSDSSWAWGTFTHLKESPGDNEYLLELFFRDVNESTEAIGTLAGNLSSRLKKAKLKKLKQLGEALALGKNISETIFNVAKTLEEIEKIKPVEAFAEFMKSKPVIKWYKKPVWGDNPPDVKFYEDLRDRGLGEDSDKFVDDLAASKDNLDSMYTAAQQLEALIKEVEKTGEATSAIEEIPDTALVDPK